MENLSSLCLQIFAIQHEFLHTLGMQHEHQRPDIDKWMIEDPSVPFFAMYHKLKRRKDKGENLTKEEESDYNTYMRNYYKHVSTFFN